MRKSWGRAIRILIQVTAFVLREYLGRSYVGAFVALFQQESKSDVTLLKRQKLEVGTSISALTAEREWF